MAYSDYCPYKELTAKPCWKCHNYIPDTDECGLNCSASTMRNKGIDTMWTAQTYEERLKDYERKRQEYLKLSKEALVDLILQRPTLY